MKTFIQKALSIENPTEEELNFLLNEYVDDWHNIEIDSPFQKSLSEYLGITKEEYEDYVLTDKYSLLNLINQYKSESTND